MRTRWTLILMIVVFAAALAATGCGTVGMGGPISKEELFRQRNTDPRLGNLVIRGSKHVNIWIKDEAGREVKALSVNPKPQDRVFTYNNRRPEQWIPMILEPGSYRVEYIFDYHVVKALGLVRYPFDEPLGYASIFVGRDPLAAYYEGIHWGWILILDGGDAPLPAPIPRIRFNCNFPIIC